MRCPFKDSLDYRMRQYLKNKNKDRQTDRHPKGHFEACDLE